MRGSWDGVGLAVAARERAEDGVLAAARTELFLEGGRYRVKARVFSGQARELSLAAMVTLNGSVIARVLLSGPEGEIPVEGTFDHEGGRAVLDVAVEGVGPGLAVEPVTVWYSNLAVERFPPLDIIPRR